jgi:hypothetical protein
MHVSCFESVGYVKYIIRNIVSHSFVHALLIVPILLRGLRSFDSIEGTKPTLEDQLDFAVFDGWNGYPYLSIWPIYQWDLLCD